MKTAKQFAYFIDSFGKGKWSEPKTITDLTNAILERDKQIQLDAMKEGMRRAAGFCRGQAVWQDSHYQILTASEQLTISDL